MNNNNDDDIQYEELSFNDENARLLICIRGQNLESLNGNQNNRSNNNSEHSDDISQNSNKI